MPSYSLLLKISECENIAFVEPQNDRRWGLKLACAGCSEVTENFIFFSAADDVELDGGGNANANFSCKFCRKAISINVDERQYKRYDCSKPSAQTVAVFEVRGGEPTEALLEDAWTVTASGESETTFNDGVNLDEDWCEYDAKSDQSVSILGVTHAFERCKV